MQQPIWSINWVCDTVPLRISRPAIVPWGLPRARPPRSQAEARPTSVLLPRLSWSSAAFHRSTDVSIGGEGRGFICPSSVLHLQIENACFGPQPISVREAFFVSKSWNMKMYVRVSNVLSLDEHTVSVGMMYREGVAPFFCNFYRKNVRFHKIL